MKSPVNMVATAIIIATLAACSSAPTRPRVALDSLNAQRLMTDIQKLSSDQFEGRAPGSHGEELTLAYLEGEFRKAGLEPGNPNGTYLQKVPLVGITADPSMKLTIAGKGRSLAPAYLTDYVATTQRVQPEVSLDADIIFTGYGVQAPEFQWDDFKGADVKGKVIIVLVNDPPLPDEKIFGGKAMTYYGRWTYKYEKCAEMGAAGCFIIHETGPAGYGWGVVQGGWSGERFDLSTPDKNMGRAAVDGWFTWEQADRIFKAAGQDLAKLKAAAATREFKPVPLNLRAKLTIKNTLREVQSNNVIARLTGSDPARKDEFVIYTAHWDHFGIGKEINGDKIYNGARDNASGTAALLEMARAFKALGTPPRRSLLFLAVTAEEQGLLGSRYYAENPLYPLAKTAANINMDVVNVWGKTKDIVSIGMGMSTLDEVVGSIATELGRTVKPDAEPEKGFYYRSDHFEFAKQGVPAFDPDDGIEFIGKPEGTGLKLRQQYTAEDYHKPSDQVKDWWDLSGAIQDMKLFLLVGYKVANDPQMPEWKPGTEFKAKRDAMMKKQ